MNIKADCSGCMSVCLHVRGIRAGWTRYAAVALLPDLKHSNHSQQWIEHLPGLE